jgi:hypothetical protein
MRLPLVNLALVFVAALYLVRGTLRFFRREERQTFFKFFSYVAVWGAILTFGLFPQTSRSLSIRLGFGDNLNTLVFLGFVVVFVALFKLINAVEGLERNISEIVRREALQQLETTLEHRAALSRESQPGPGSPTGAG